MLLICWSLSVSFENLTGGEDLAAVDAAAGVGLEVVVALEAPDLAAMLLRVSWHFSCCFLNLSNFSCNAICT